MEVVSFIVAGMLWLGGLGFLFVKVDDDSWCDDDRRFGTPSPKSFLSPYFIVRIESYRVASAAVMLLLGLLFLSHGLGWVGSP